MSKYTMKVKLVIIWVMFIICTLTFYSLGWSWFSAVTGSCIATMIIASLFLKKKR